MSDNFSDGSPTVSTPSPESAPAPASTPAAAPEVSSTPAPTPDASTAPPSSAPGDTKESLLSAVMAVVKTDPEADKVKLPGEGATPAPTEPQPETAGTAGPSEAELSDDPSKEELDRYHSRTRKRIDKLLEQRNEARNELTALRGDAQIATGLRNYLQQNDIQKEDFSVLLDLGAALRRGDWTTFYQGIRPYVDLAEESLGIRLPTDLAQRVQQGHMTTEAARTFAQERSARQLAESNAERANYHANQQAQQVQQVQTQHQQQALTQGVQSAVAAWEASVRQSDPDYGHKQDAVKSLLWAVVQEKGAPQSPEQAVEIAKEAYRRANEMVTKLAPRPKATAAVPSSVNRNSGATPEPKSLMEAAVLGLSKSRRSA